MNGKMMMDAVEEALRTDNLLRHMWTEGVGSIERLDSETVVLTVPRKAFKLTIKELP